MSNNSQPDLLPAGHNIAGHVVTRLLGRGAMGDVYEVVHEETGESYALKLLNEEMLGSRGIVERFRKEADIMTSLDHPNIAKVDASGLEEGRHWLRVELLGGMVFEVGAEEVTTLSDFISYRGGRLSQGEVLECLRQFLDALRYAHGRGIIHRDLKPANILIHEGGMKIADFGIVATMGEEWLRTQVQQTVASTIARGGRVNDLVLDDSDFSPEDASLIGTYAYMSPEQKEGQPATPQSDLYAVGLICFHMLTGQKEPRFKLPSKIHDDIDPSWDKFILGALEKAPSDRYADAGFASDALETVSMAMEGIRAEVPIKATKRPIKAKRPITGSNIPKNRSKRIVRHVSSGGENRTMVLVLAAILMVAAILGLFWFLSSPKDDESPDNALANPISGNELVRSPPLVKDHISQRATDTGLSKPHVQIKTTNAQESPPSNPSSKPDTHEKDVADKKLAKPAPPEPRLIPEPAPDVKGNDKKISTTRDLAYGAIKFASQKLAVNPKDLDGLNLLRFALTVDKGNDRAKQLLEMLEGDRGVNPLNYSYTEEEYLQKCTEISEGLKSRKHQIMLYRVMVLIQNDNGYAINKLQHALINGERTLPDIIFDKIKIKKSKTIPSDAQKFQGHSYKIYQGRSTTTWEQAKRNCEEVGGYLAVVKSPRENAFITSLIQRSNYRGAWIGAKVEDLVNKRWVWTDRSLGLLYQNWASGYPRYTSNQYGALYIWSDGKWRDTGPSLYSSYSYVWVCEWN